MASSATISPRGRRRQKAKPYLFVVALVLVVTITVVQFSFFGKISSSNNTVGNDQGQHLQTEQLIKARAGALSNQQKTQVKKNKKAAEPSLVRTEYVADEAATVKTFEKKDTPFADKEKSTVSTVVKPENTVGAATPPDDSPRERKHSCLNKDFTNTHDRAIFSLLIPKEKQYLTAARVMGASVDLYTNNTDKVILELSTHPLSRYQWAQLQRVGWTHKCTIAPIRPLKTPSPRFVDQFSKLHVWGMSLYDVAVYMDADTVAVRDMNELMHMQLGSEYKIGVTADYRQMNSSTAEEFTSTFNMGVFMIHPNWTEYRRLVKLHEDGAVNDYEYIMAEQGWLNAVYEDQWKEIGLVYNANVAGRNHPKFKEKQNELRIIHYTTMKPWTCKPRSSDLFCRPWLDIRNGIVAKSGCTNKDFVPTTGNKVAMVTFVTDMRTWEAEQQSTKDRKVPPRTREKADYTYGAAALGKSIQEHVDDDKVDRILLEIPTRRLPDADRAYLKSVGWNICTVNPIESKYFAARFIDQFNKFHAWSFVEYDRLIYLDSDTLVVGNIDKFLQTNLTEGKMIGVTQDYVSIRFIKTFNMGVFLIHPNMTEFHRLMKLQANDEVQYDHHQSEQGFLNVVYEKQWQEIGIEHNANFAIYAYNRFPWKWPANPGILHFTLEKPWQESLPEMRSVNDPTRMNEFLQIWTDAATKYGVWPPANASTTNATVIATAK